MYYVLSTSGTPEIVNFRRILASKMVWESVVEALKAKSGRREGLRGFKRRPREGKRAQDEAKEAPRGGQERQERPRWVQSGLLEPGGPSSHWYLPPPSSDSSPLALPRAT